MTRKNFILSSMVGAGGLLLARKSQASRSFVAASSQVLYSLSTPGLAITGFPFTFSCWIKPTSLIANMVLMSANSATDFGVYMIVQTSAMVAVVTNGGSPAISTALSTGVWQHVAMQAISSTDFYVWLNGVKVHNPTVGSGGAPAAFTKWCLGSFFLTGTPTFSNPWDGLIEHAAWWNLALPDQKITDLYNRRNPKLLNFAGFRTLLSFTESSQISGTYNDPLTDSGGSTFNVDRPLIYGR